VTAVYVTHDQTEAFAVADRVVVMNAGRTEQIAAPQELFARPATPFVARFLGFHNLLDGVVVESGIAATKIGRLPFDGEGEIGTAVTLLIRPESVQLAMNNEQLTTGSPSSFILHPSSFITGLSFRGRYTQVLLACNGVPLMAELPDFPRWRVGDEVAVAVTGTQVVEARNRVPSEERGS
ncbi:MAG: TOBE domain-containing protein, partial [Anaerolineales bacterium]|nr:TOBE domain-containing protein [Anaerolineales bacterium]